MGIRIVQVDAFTSTPFAGNPAAVCVLPAPRDERWMRKVAQEMNLSETAFLHREGDGFRLRWFTPAVEVDLCGHATLASAHVLWEAGHLSPDESARFHTRSGLLTATRRGEWIELDFPEDPPAAVTNPMPAALAVRTSVTWVGKGRHSYFVEAGDEAEVRGMVPDFARLAELG